MKKEVKIGIIGILALVMLFLGINYLKGVRMFHASTYYYVEYTDINGLANSSPVFASGYKVGLVRDIQYNHANPGHVVVEVEMDQDMRVPKGSRGELVTDMLGTVKMNLILNLQSMDSILHSLNQLLANPALKATVENAEKLTANLNVTTHQLNKLMQNDLPQLTGRMVTIADNFTIISDNLKEIDYANTFQKIDSTLQNVQLLTNKLNSKDNTIGLLFNDASLYQNLNTTTANAASLLEDLQKSPKRYVHFSLFGKKDDR